MSIEKYINNIKYALGRAEKKLSANTMNGIDKDMAFAFQQISKREEVCGDRLKHGETALAMRILMAKYFDLHIKIKFQNAWELLGMYQANFVNGQYKNALDASINIDNVLRDLLHVYEVAVRHKMERRQFSNFQPFINIPAQLHIFMSCFERVRTLVFNPTVFEQRITISPANNRFSHFYQPAPSEDTLAKCEQMQNNCSF